VHPFDQSKTSFDFNDFRKTIAIAVRFLDNVIDCSESPLDKTHQMMKNWRRIGLGFTGLGDTFAMMCMTYGEKESIKLSQDIAKTLRDESYTTSSLLALERGCFPECNKEKLMQSKFIQRLPDEIKQLISKNGLRNISLNTCAPTGTTSIALGNNCSSGIEPIFSLEYKRRVRINGTSEFSEESVKDYAWLLYLNKIKSQFHCKLVYEQFLFENPLLFNFFNFNPIFMQNV
jgi:ribonucleoside-diphosphate reductase alpha chain